MNASLENDFNSSIKFSVRKGKFKTSFALDMNWSLERVRFQILVDNIMSNQIMVAITFVSKMNYSYLRDICNFSSADFSFACLIRKDRKKLQKNLSRSQRLWFYGSIAKSLYS